MAYFEYFQESLVLNWNSSNVIMSNASMTLLSAITIETVMMVVMRGRLSAKWLVCIMSSYFKQEIIYICSLIQRGHNNQGSVQKVDSSSAAWVHHAFHCTECVTPQMIAFMEQMKV